MQDPAFIQKIENGEVSREQAIHDMIVLYRTAWSTIAWIKQVFEAIDEAATAAQLGDSLDRLQFAMDEHYSIDMDGDMHVRT